MSIAQRAGNLGSPVCPGPSRSCSVAGGARAVLAARGELGSATVLKASVARVSGPVSVEMES
jgi:hypothetical protein